MLRRRIEDRDGPDAVPWQLKEPSRDWDWIMNSVRKEDWRWLWEDGVKAGLFRYGHVIGGSIEGVQALNELGDVIAITSRPKEAVHDTLVWLSTMFDKAPLSGINILSHGQLKSDVRPRPDVFIDDGVHNVTDVLEHTEARVVLFDQPWNQDYECPEGTWSRCARAVGWRAVVDLVRAVKAEVW